MGGLLIIGSIVLTTLLLGDLRNSYVWLALATVAGLACLGATDDWIKLNRHRRAAAGKGAATRQGLTGKQKLIVQITFGLLVSWLTIRLGDHSPHATRLYFPFFKEETGAWLALPTWLFVLWGAFLLTGASNSVNLTDGLDGLASGCTAFVAFVLVVFGIVVGDEQLARSLLYPSMPGASQLAPVAGAIGGACLGFLWFNAHPARVFMGDTGSLALGGLLGYVALVLRQEVLLAIVGAIFVAEALSVMLQVYYFKYTRIRFGEGRRIFRMSPLHHHFQKCGWSESQVVVRFWLVGAMLAVVGLATLRLR
jgi:phospho-N-acetylmuramoyl-pentapeptide-transferase